jgi:Tfp pilus assembly protein PilN
MVEINLIPDVKQELLKAQRMRLQVISTAIIVSIVAGAVVAILALYVFGIQFARNTFADDAINKGSAKLAEVEDLSKMLTIQNQLSKVNELNGTRQIDSRLFDVLSSVIPPAPNSVLVSSVNLNAETSTITLEGQTRAYDSMEVFKKTLDSSVIVFTQDGTEKQVKLASDISTSNIGYGEDEAGNKVLVFTLSFKYSEELFSPKNPVVTFKLSVNGNVTDSYLGIPRSIFTEKAKDL